MNINDLRKNNLIIFECISGSKAYGLDTEKSDTDIKGVFITPKDHFYGFTKIDQISDESNDTSFYELQKFLRLLSKNNPNILEMLYTPQESIIFEHSIFSKIKNKCFLSKLCEDTFVNYAMGQIKKAQGLNKKIKNPMPENRLEVIDFCYVTNQNGSENLRTWLSSNNINQNNCGLSALPHFTNTYLLFHSKNEDFRGIINDSNGTDSSNNIRTSSIPKGLKHLGYLHFNFDAYKSHCKSHKDYWEWVKKRNPDRYNTNTHHGKNYDSKNMLHVFRLLDTAYQIATKKIINFKLYDRDFLLKIKAGEFDYEYLIKLAEDKTKNLKDLFSKSNLPKTPDLDYIDKLLVQTRKSFYIK